MYSLRPRYKNKLLNRLTPNYSVDFIEDISVADLKGIKAFAFDADSTLVEANQIIIRPDSLVWLEGLTVPIYLTTNRPAPRGDDLGKLINANAVVHANINARKPQTKYFDKLAESSGLPLRDIVMVGDRLLTDIYGGNKAGMTTIHVKALGRDPAYIRWSGLRLFEKLLIKLVAKKV